MIFRRDLPSPRTKTTLLMHCSKSPHCLSRLECCSPLLTLLLQTQRPPALQILPAEWPQVPVQKAQNMWKSNPGGPPDSHACLPLRCVLCLSPQKYLNFYLNFPHQGNQSSLKIWESIFISCSYHIKHQ